MSEQQRFTHERENYWSEFGRESDQWRGKRAAYQRRLGDIYAFMIPPGMRVLEIGCGQGDLLARLQPSYGVGIDLSPVMVELAQTRHSNLTFHCADIHDLSLNEKFDYIVASDLFNDLWDVERAVRQINLHCGPQTRLIANTYSRVWELPRRLAVGLGMAKKQLIQNWLTPDDIQGLLYLGGLETLRSFREILWPLGPRPIADWVNKNPAKFWPLNTFAIANFVVARPIAQKREAEARVTVVVPARNEAGNIANILERIPDMGAGTELIFVEGNSTDNTWQVIQEELARRPRPGTQILQQTGKGKGDAVRLGFRHATGDLLMILDADLTVAPEDLPRFYEAWINGKADFVNGVRLVYPMHGNAMRFFNLLGNRFFSMAFSWLMSQRTKDTLCGTKVLSRHDYEKIAANRSYFGDFDPFGDFDLLFGAARFNLKILDMPVRYGERTYGDTNIRRWHDGAILLRMVIYSLRRLKLV